MAILNKLAFTVDSVGNNTFVRIPALHIENLELVGGVPVTFDAPEGTTSLLFSANGEYWVNPNGSTAAVCAGGSELNPMGYQISNETRISIIAPEDVKMSICCYA